MLDECEPGVEAKASISSSFKSLNTKSVRKKTSRLELRQAFIKSNEEGADSSINEKHRLANCDARKIEKVFLSTTRFRDNCDCMS